MKNLFRPLLLALLVTMALVSCRNNVPKEAKYIPKEASVVLVVDPQQMQDKLQKGGISIDTLINRIFKKDSTDAKDKARFDDLKDNAGISWGDKIFAFATQKMNTDNSQSNTFTVLAGLKDAAKLEAYLKKQEELKNKEIKKEKDYSYITTGDGTMLAWNEQQLILTMYTHAQKPVYDTVAMEFKRPSTVNNEAEIKTIVNHYFTQKVNESLADVSIFTDMFKEKADGYAFTSPNSSLGALSVMPIQIPKLEELIKDNYMTSTLSFEDGKIIAKSTSYTNQLLSSVLKQYAGPTVNLSMIENYPSQNINGIMLVAFNPEIFGGILKQLEVEGLVNNFLEKGGVTSQDLYKSLKGDIAVVVSDLGMSEIEPQNKHNEKSMMHKKPLGKMILSAPVGDKKSFLKLMDKVAEHGFLVKQNNIYKAGEMATMLGIFIMADENNLVIASDSLTYTQYMAKTNKAVINKEALDKFKGKSMVMYFDIANTLNGFTKDDSPENHFHHSITSAKETFKDVIATSDNFDGKSIKGSIEVRMQNEKQNSLVTLTSLITNIAVDMRVQAKREKEMEEKLFPGGVPAVIRTN
ncbi:MAG: DUF4836 family protein [Ginsengibacter sp.]